MDWPIWGVDFDLACVALVTSWSKPGSDPGVASGSPGRGTKAARWLHEGRTACVPTTSVKGEGEVSL